MFDTKDLASKMMSSRFKEDAQTKQKKKDTAWWQKYIHFNPNQFKADTAVPVCMSREIRFDMKSDPLKTYKDGKSALDILNKELQENFSLHLEAIQPEYYKEDKQKKVVWKYKLVHDAVPSYLSEDSASIMDVPAYIKSCNTCIRRICIELAKNHMTPAYIFREDAVLGIQYPYGVPKTSKEVANESNSSKS